MSAPIRVLQVNSLMQGGGADNQTLELSAGLRDLGCDVTLLIPDVCRWEKRARDVGVSVETFSQKPSPRRAFIQSAAQLVRRKKIDVVHAHQGRDYWPAIFAARLGGARTVVTRHLMTRPRWFSRWGLLSCAEVVGVSEAVTNVLRRELHGPVSRLHRIFCGIDFQKFQTAQSEAASAFRAAQGFAPEHVVYGVIGAHGLPHGKGQMEFVHAAAKVHAQFPETRFIIIGDGEMGPLLQQKIGEFGLKHAVRIVPFTEQIVAATQALDVLVHPAIGSEAFGLVILEAMACAKPVVASRLDGIPELFRAGEHGFFAGPGNIGELAEAMSALAGDANLRQRLGAAGRCHVASNFTRETMAERTLDVYLKLCGATSRVKNSPCHSLRRTIPL